MTIKDDHNLSPTDEDPLALMGVRRLMAIAAAVILAAAGGILLLVGLALGTDHIWNLGLACLLGGLHLGSHAGHLDTTRRTLHALEHALREEEARADAATTIEHQILAQLNEVLERLDAMERRAPVMTARLDDVEIRLGRLDALPGEVGHLGQQQAHLAEKLAQFAADELRKKRQARSS